MSETRNRGPCTVCGKTCSGRGDRLLCRACWANQGPKVCRVEGCNDTGETNTLRRGMCNRHYILWRRYGDPTDQKQLSPGQYTTCQVEGCEREHFTKGYCKAHHDRVVATGSPGSATISPAAPPYPLDAVCKVDGCDKPPRGQGMCKSHYSMHRDTPKVCEVIGCNEPARGARGWCTNHYVRWRKYGDPTKTKRRPNIPAKCVMPGCNEPHRSADLCAQHYKQARYLRPAESRLLAGRVAMFDGKCYICGDAWEAIDHVKPVSRGGAFKQVSNLRPICRQCNSIKSGSWEGVDGLAGLIESVRARKMEL